MPSTYTLNNGIELIGTGEQSGTWGDTTNTNLSLLDTALDGQVTVTLASAGNSGSPNNLPISDGAASDGRNRMITFADGGDLGATAYVQLTPNDSEKIIYVRNSLSGSRSIIMFQGTYNASNDYEIPAGTTAVIYFDGAGSGAVAANVFNNAHFDALNVVGNVTVGGDVTVTGTVDAGTVEFDNLSGTGAVSVTNILDEDNMASDSATALSTQQSIKAYVDAQVGTVDTLAEILANGNTTGGTDIAVSTGDDITFADSSKAIFGAGSDLQIYHDGTHSYVSDQGTGNLRLLAANFQVNTSGNDGTYIRAGNSDDVELFYGGTGGSVKLATTATGIDVTGNATFADNGKAIFGAGSDLQIYHDGSNSYIDEVGAGVLKVRSNGTGIDFESTGGETLAQFVTNGAVTLYHNNADKLATTSTGIDVTGNANFADNGKAIFGAGSDLQIYHDGDNSYIDDAGTGDLYLRSSNDLIFTNADGSETYARFQENGYVRLFYDNDLKLETTSVGIQVTGTQAGTKILLESTDAGGADGPILDLYRNSASPAATDDIGQIYFSGENSTDAKVQYAEIYTFIQDPTAGAEDGRIDIRYMAGGSAKLGVQLRGDTGGTDGEVIINQNGADMDFRVESSTTVNAMRIVGSTGNVGLGLSDPEDTLHIAGRVRIDASTPLLRFQEDDTTDENFDVGVSGGEFIVRTNNDNFDSSTTRFKITQDGDVRIGALLSSDFGGVLNVSSNGNDTQLALVSTDADALVGPDLKLLRASASPADGDITGRIRFVAYDDGGNEITIARILTEITDVTDTSEDGKLEVETAIDGASRSRLLFNNTSSIFNDSGQDLDFVVESSNKADALFVQGNTGRLGLGTDVPTAPLHVKDDTVGALVMLEVTDGANNDIAPELTLYRNYTTPADGDVGGSLEFNLNDSTGVNTTFSRIYGAANDITNGTEDGAIYFHVRENGALNEKMRVNQGGVGIGVTDIDAGFDLQVQGSSKFTKNNNDTNILLESTDGDADDGPVIVLDRNSGSPANNDNLAKTYYRGRNSAAEETDYVVIRAEARTVTDGGEDGRYQMSMLKDGTLVNVFDIDLDGASNEIVFNGSGADIDFRVDGSGGANVLFVNAGQDSVIMGNNSTITSNPRLAVHQGSSGLCGEMYRASSTGTATLLNLYSDVGGTQNNTHHFEANGDLEIDGTLTESSDQRIKQDIVDSASQWDDIKAVQVRKYRRIWDVEQYGDDADVQLGVVAQELEASNMGGLVKTRLINEDDPDSGDIKSVKYSILYMKAVKALQEAMERIETLEAKVTALENS
jgi:hypothetical protein